MKKIFALLIISAITFTSCSDDNDDNLKTKTEAKTSFNFTHNWDDTAIAGSDFENTQYTNANGEMITMTRLRYIISDVTFTKANGESTTIEGYKLVDVTNDDLNYNPEMKIPTGAYTSVSFTYGLKHEDNIDGAYTDLNSASFNVPMAALGGGYHYMQFDGKYTNSTVTDAPFNYHHIRAVNAGMPPVFPDQPTFITVDLGAMTISDDITIEVKMNVAEWFKNPNTWDLNVLNQVLMPNANAQLLMNQNGQNVFGLGTVTQ
ncbi:MbnP family protein [uncultured Lacinutrix sp.]|uniref:MbnP family protein n=1 Tax=uncultured Lacinutrix sp. TaxID=574032 RepID=UPI00262F18EE|nr:MbnP family protein [uncultured Lacinutrix sp.]